ncbi:Rhs element Vgr protein [Dyadobacter jejuensis]|uniref:Rhs element Vgr protein n=1 Tax=Dyadobacter jejuensis TaxID=1082580 RepID=A0A316AIJ5_9BACT|nr:type VI secretion system tip protein VgrG [Dyadobacter jejuensis]PWJ57472.1 Rhs element Vgr protein [Dyadobacter jejuensis]
MSLTSALTGAGDTPTDQVSKEILINGTALSNEINVIRFSVSKVYNKVATAKLMIDDGSVADMDFPQSNSDLFKPGQEIEIRLGYDENPSTIFKGIIIRHTVKIRNGSYLEVEAKDKAIKLTTHRKNKTFVGTGLKDSQVMEEIIGSVVEKEVEPTTVSHKQLVQYATSDWDFILTRAEANSMMVLTDDGKLVIKKPEMDQDSGLTFAYGGTNNIIEFEAEMDVRHQPNSTTSTSWNYLQQAGIEPITGTSSFPETGNITSTDLGAVLGADVELKHSGYIPEPQLRQWADSYALRKNMSKVYGRLQVSGRPTLKPGHKITLDGVGDRFNGPVLITGVLHQYNGNYLTDIQFGWSDEWFFQKDDIQEKPAAGLLPGVNGLQIAVVQAIAGDPDQGFRVQVKLPMVSLSTDGIWARVASVDAGNQRGFLFRPEIGDEVILGFINDDPRDAVILGMLHSQEFPPPITPAEGNPTKGYVSREGMKIVFDDQNKSTTITVPVGSKDASTLKSITLDQSQIELKDEFDNSIKMDSSGITISSKLIVTVEGKPINLN